MEDNTLEFRLEYISPTLRLVVSKEHTFGTDALLLASFATGSHKKLACDLGTGCGIIPFYWLKNNSVGEIYAVDIQEKAIEQLKKSLEINFGNPESSECGDELTDNESAARNRQALGLEINGLIYDIIHPLCCDLRNIDDTLPFGQFDLVTMNPPYTKVGAGVISDSSADKIARHETECTFFDVTAAAKKLLKFGGSLCMCIRPERLVELIVSMRENKIEPKRLRFVSQRVGSQPWLCLVEGKLGRNPGLIVEKELYIETDGHPSDEMLEILGDYRKK